MALQHIVLDATTTLFSFLSKSGKTMSIIDANQYQQKAKIPAWSQNLWPMPDGGMSAIVRVVGIIPTLTTPIKDKIDAGENVRLYPVRVGGSHSTILIGESFWATLTADGWKKHTEFFQASNAIVAILKDTTYLFTSGTGLSRYKTDLPDGTPLFELLEGVATEGLDFTRMNGLCAAISYLVATDGTTIYWSSPLNPTKWTPGGIGDDAGAGATKVLAAKGNIQFLVGMPDGFYIFTDTNIVRARYSNNPNNPWVFTEVPNSSAVYSYDNVVVNTNAGALFVWSQYGLGVLQDGRLDYIFPEATDLLAGSVFETFNTTTKKIDATYNDSKDVVLQYIGGRYLLASYGKTGQIKKFILLYDTLSKKWGRIRIDHVAIAIFRTPDFEGLNYWDWVTDAWDSTWPFVDMQPQRVAATVDALSLGVLTPEGQFHRLTATDIFTQQVANALAEQLGIPQATLTYSILNNSLVYENMQLVKSRQIELSEVRLIYSYPTYPDPDVEGSENVLYSKDTTTIIGYSSEDVTLREFLSSYSVPDEELFVERVRGTKVNLILENINSIQGIEISIRPTSVR
jgi:hypothetical protein